MVSFTTLLVAFAVVATAAAGNVQMEPSVHTFSSSKWLKEKSLKDTDMVKAIFVLKHDSFAIQKFEKKLLGISTPKSATYGKFMKVSYFSK